MADTIENLRAHGYTLVQESVPPIGFNVVVLSRRCRCLGYLDGSMTWRHASDHGLIQDVIAWSLLGQEEK
ncbi:MAG TPA: hypothetical protein VMZ27_16105 [Candidatus Saccharimonadales bacterium]|nr:hypothetical protein [Candidatus Saccharimonadales bacterium]